MPRVSLNQTSVRERQRILYERYGGFMSVANLMKELGVSRNTALKFAATLPSHSPTGVKRYDILDVARKLEETLKPPEVK